MRSDIFYPGQLIRIELEPPSGDFEPELDEGQIILTKVHLVRTYGNSTAILTDDLTGVHLWGAKGGEIKMIGSGWITAIGYEEEEMEFSVENSQSLNLYVRTTPYSQHTTGQAK